MKRAILFFAIVCLAGACNPEKGVEPVDADKLSGTWRLVEPASPYKLTLVLESQFVPSFTALSFFKVSGKAVINTYGTSLTIPSGTSTEVSVNSSISTTKVGGPTEAIQFEQAYLNALGSANRYELTNRDRLRLYHRQGSATNRLVYERVN